MEYTSDNDAVARIYALRVLPQSNGCSHTVVSFDTDSPGDLILRAEWPDIMICAATAKDGIYHMLVSKDRNIVSKLITFNLATGVTSEIRTYGSGYDTIGNISVRDMTYDHSAGLIYAVGSNVAEMEESVEKIPCGLFCIDPGNGDFQLVGYQETADIISVFAGDKELFGLDNEGRIWIINRNNGRLGDLLCETGLFPAGPQSVYFDFRNNKYYWTSYTRTDEGSAVASELRGFTISEEWEFIFDDPVAIVDNSELTGLYVDSDPADRRRQPGVSSLIVIPGSEGKPAATLTWTVPAALSADMRLTASVYRDGDLVAEVENIAPGEQCTFTDSSVPVGVHVYSVELDAKTGNYRPTFAEPVYIGIDSPGAPVDVKAVKAADSYYIIVSWNPPAAGEHGGWYDPVGLTYRVTRYPDCKVVAELTASNTITDHTVTDETDPVQHVYSYAVCVVSGDACGPVSESEPVISGRPIEPPYLMDLATPEEAGLWRVFDGDSDGCSWNICRTGWGGTEEPFFRYNPDDKLDVRGSADDWLISPAFRLEKDKYYSVKYEVRLLGSAFPVTSRLLLGNGPTPGAMKHILEKNIRETGEMEWIGHAVPFTVRKSGDYCFGYNLKNRVPVQLYKFSVVKIDPVHLSATELSGAALCNIGTSYGYSVTVVNDGFNPVDHFIVRLVDKSGKEIISQKFDRTVSPQMSEVVTIFWTPQVAGECEITAQVAADGTGSFAGTAGLNVKVFGNDSTIDITDGDTVSGCIPVFTRHRSSISQTVYSRDTVDKEGVCKISGLTYYISDFAGAASLSMDLDIRLAETDIADFSSASPIAEADFVKVYHGLVTISKGDRTLNVTFDKAFSYTGRNLCIQVSHVADSVATLLFTTRYGKSDPDLSILCVSDNGPADFGGEITRYRDRPNLTLILSEKSDE